MCSWDAHGAQTSYERRDAFVDPNSGEIAEPLINFELHRTRETYGKGILDTLCADWQHHHGADRGTTMTHPDGTTTYRTLGDETLTSIATKLSTIPLMSASALLESNVYRLSRSSKTLTPMSGNASHGLTLKSKLKADTVLRLPRWEA